jgi:hypothetical protein
MKMKDLTRENWGIVYLCTTLFVCVPLRVKRQGREVDHSPPNGAGVNNDRAKRALSHTSSWRAAYVIKPKCNFTLPYPFCMYWAFALCHTSNFSVSALVQLFLNLKYQDQECCTICNENKLSLCFCLIPNADLSIIYEEGICCEFMWSGFDS